MTGRTESDEAAIRDVIATDTRCYTARDLEGWSDCFVQSDRMASILSMQRLGLLRRQGFDAFRETIQTAMESEPSGSEIRVRHENFRISVLGDMAWTTFDQFVDRADDPLAPPAATHEVRVLERDDGRWRIVLHFVFEPRQSINHGPLIEVDTTGSVLWMNEAARDGLAKMGGLHISQGILRPARPNWSAAFRQTLAAAADHLDYARHNTLMLGTGGAARFPVILGDDAEGAMRVVTISVEDFRIYVSFDDEAALDRRLRAAEIVFGLSAAQKRVAMRIAGGQDLPEIASELGISVNTVRTHLRRMFEKTGTNGQPALMRILLTVGG